MPRYVIVDRSNKGLYGDTHGEEFDNPIAAAITLDASCYPPDARPPAAKYQEVGRRSTRAVLDVYTLAAGESYTEQRDGEPPHNETGYWIARECEYVTSLARE